jgi:hypothetical protein
MALRFGKTDERRVRSTARLGRTGRPGGSGRVDRTPLDGLRREPSAHGSPRSGSEDVELEVRAALYGSRTTGVQRLARPH